MIQIQIQLNHHPVKINKILFLEKISNKNDKKFYNEFIDTQQFCQNIVKDELKYFTTMANNYNHNKKDLLSSSLTSIMIIIIIILLIFP